MSRASFHNISVLSIKQFSRAQVERVLRETRRMNRLYNYSGARNLLKGNVLACLFFEPSTRTSTSFQTAMLRLGGRAIVINDEKTSAVAKGESLEDTVRSLASYVDVIAMRHYQVGAAARAAKCLTIPLINAGDGMGEHPTQALLDLYTIQKECGGIENKVVTMLGDLVHNRTVQSLTHVLSLFPSVKINYVSPEPLRMPKELLDDLKAKKITFTQASELDKKIMKETDVLYVTRVQKERLDPKLYESVAKSYRVTPDTLTKLEAPPTLRILHPLPRVDEIAPEVDADPRAAYFRQMRNGLLTRMALLNLILGKSSS